MTKCQNKKIYSERYSAKWKMSKSKINCLVACPIDHLLTSILIVVGGRSHSIYVRVEAWGSI